MENIYKYIFIKHYILLFNKKIINIKFSYLLIDCLKIVLVILIKIVAKITIKIFDIFYLLLELPLLYLTNKHINYY